MGGGGGVNGRVTAPRTLRAGSLNVCSYGTDEMKREAQVGCVSIE